jgi:hypothetical protein
MARLVELIVLNIGHDAGVLNDQGNIEEEERLERQAHSTPFFC